ncbi:hypothetical protein SSX86_028765 [Deinandra increscens subsp. villosa]|uniref:TF-B3 domain-containing protein n=1 Tax=Deinandra increscens subsp. villosa TaxID=3103831 RepID=A0AAP0GKT0_9ASTR
MGTSRNSEPEARPPSFFKTIRYPSAPHLCLPNAFVRRHFDKIPKNPKLVTETGEHSWRVEFKKIGEDYCFANGWEKLAQDMQLCLKDIAVFWLIDPSTFKVMFLGHNGWEKDLQFDKTNFAVDDDDDVDDDEVMPAKILRFTKVYCWKTYKYAMSLPISFVKAAGLERTESIKLKDHEGKEWTMKILAERYARTKYSLSAGWAVFRRHHKLTDGDVCKFTFNKNEGILNLAKLVKKERPIKQETPMDEVDRNRGSRSCYGGGNGKNQDDWWWVAEKRGGGGGGVKVKDEYESGPEAEVGGRKGGQSLLKSFAKVRIEDGLDRKRGVLALAAEKPKPKPKPSSRGDGVEVQSDQGEFKSRHVIYF